MNSKVEALRQLYRGDGIFDDEQFERVAKVFGVDDLDRFNKVLIEAASMIPEYGPRTCFESALNLDCNDGNLEVRRHEVATRINRSFRTVIRYEIAATEQAAARIPRLLKWM